MNEYYVIKRSNDILKDAIWKVYRKKCFYCGRMIDVNELEIDHIIPKNPEKLVDSFEKEELLDYIKLIEGDGFTKDCIMNYLPSCGHCNKQKGNRYFTLGNLRYFHEQAKRKSERVISEIEKNKYKKPNKVTSDRNEQLINAKKENKDLLMKKIIIDGIGKTYYAQGLGRVRVDAYLPTNLKDKLSCLILFKEEKISKCSFTFEGEEITNIFFQGYRTGINKERNFIWYINGEEIALKFPNTRFETDRKTVEELCEIMDDLFIEYDKRRSKLINTVGGREFEEISDGIFKMISLPKYIWIKMCYFADGYAYNSGNSKWNIFCPLNDIEQNRIRLYKNYTSKIEADILVDLEIDNINEDYVNLLWKQGFSSHVTNEMDGFDDKIKWTIEYTHDWVINEWIPYIFYKEEKDKRNWIEQIRYRNLTFEIYKKKFILNDFNIKSAKPSD